MAGANKSTTPQRFAACPYTLRLCTLVSGIKILEINSRPGDPESINLFPIIKDDFVDVCFKMIEGNLGSVGLEKVATVLTYKVPADYGGYMRVYPIK